MVRLVGLNLGSLLCFAKLRVFIMANGVDNRASLAPGLKSAFLEADW